MRAKLFTTFILLAIMFATILPGTALAGAYDTSFITSITYQNVDTSATTNLRIYFYDSPSQTVPIEIICGPSPLPCKNLNPGASSSLFIGGLGQIGAGFRGTAVMASDKRMIATLVQLPVQPNPSNVKNRPLSNGFASGTVNSLIATVIKDTNYISVFSVQNAGTSATDVAIKFYNTSATLVHTINANLQPGAGYFVDLGTVSQILAPFSGSVVIESTGGSIVSSAMELQPGTGTGARAFEGLGAGATTIYMPSALCNYGDQGTPSVWTNTNYAVQNSSTSPVNITVTYSPGGASQQALNVQPGTKASFNTCAAGTGNNFLGAATITSVGGNVIAMGKVAGNGLTTAYVGFSAGSAKIALPYVRWPTNANFNNGSQQRVNIAIQNVGTTTITDNILVKYIDRDGVVVGTHTITTDVPPGGKVNSNASNAGLAEFGVYPGGQFGGGAIIEGPAGSQLAAIARVASYVVATGLNAAEDYNGMAIP